MNGPVADGVRRTRAWVVEQVRVRRRASRGQLRQVVVTGVAAGVAFEIAARLLHARLPVLAPLGAILAVQPTVTRTVRAAAGQGFGVVLGVVVSLLLTRVAGLHGWSIAVVTIACLLLSRSPRFPGSGGNQLAISALLVMALGTGYGWTRVIDTAVGVGVGVVTSWVIPPPTGVARARVVLGGIARDAGDLLTEIAKALCPAQEGHADWDFDRAQEWLRRARNLDAHLRRAQETVAEAEEGVRYHPLGRTESDDVSRLAPAATALEHLISQLRTMSRTLSDLARGGPDQLTSAPPELIAYVERAGAAARAFGDLIVGQGDRDALAATVAAGRASRDAAFEAVQRAELPEGAQPAYVTLAVVVERLIDEVDPEGAHREAVSSEAP